MYKRQLVYGQMNEPPGARMRVALTGLTMAEYFRDKQGQDVLLFIDNIFRFVQAGSEVSALLGRMPSAVGYQPTLATDIGELQERITSTKDGSITSIQAVYCLLYTSTFLSLPQEIREKAALWEAEGKTTLFFETGGRLLGMIGTADAIRKDSARAVAEDVYKRQNQDRIPGLFLLS